MKNLQASTDGIETKVTKRYITITFKSIDVIDDCDSKTAGEFYYKFRVNGIIIEQLSVNDATSANNGGTIELKSYTRKVEFIDDNDTFTISGYIRERDSKNIYRNWRYTEVGSFSESFTIGEADEFRNIPLNRYAGCSVILHIDLKVTEI